MRLWSLFQKKRPDEAADIADPPSPYYTKIFDKTFDLLPAAREALPFAEGKATIDAETLANYAMEYGHGKHIRVADIPDGMSRDLLENLIRRTMQWTTQPYRLEQLSDPDRRVIWSHVEFRVDLKLQHCKAAAKLSGKTFPLNAAPRIPLPSCRLGPCHCNVRTVRKPRPIK